MSFPATRPFPPCSIMRCNIRIALIIPMRFATLRVFIHNRARALFSPSREERTEGREEKRSFPISPFESNGITRLRGQSRDILYIYIYTHFRFISIFICMFAPLPLPDPRPRYPPLPHLRQCSRPPSRDTLRRADMRSRVYTPYVGRSTH